MWWRYTPQADSEQKVKEESQRKTDCASLLVRHLTYITVCPSLHLCLSVCPLHCNGSKNKQQSAFSNLEIQRKRTKRGGGGNKVRQKDEAEREWHTWERVKVKIGWDCHSEGRERNSEHGEKEMDVSPERITSPFCTLLLPWLQSHINLIILPSDTFT